MLKLEGVVLYIKNIKVVGNTLYKGETWEKLFIYLGMET